MNIAQSIFHQHWNGSAPDYYDGQMQIPRDELTDGTNEIYTLGFLFVERRLDYLVHHPGVSPLDQLNADKNRLLTSGEIEGLNRSDIKLIMESYWAYRALLDPSLLGHDGLVEH